MSVRLSLCIATYNRGQFIGEMLESIVGQICAGVEIIIVDGASPDNTPEVVRHYTSRYSFIHYFREAQNSGVDADYDRAVGYANGEYCWLLADDDVLSPKAVSRVLETLNDDAVDLLVVDAETRDITLTKTLRRGRLAFTGVRKYDNCDFDSFLGDAGDALSFIALTIIRRDLWLSRERKKYFGSMFIHVGVIFQLPVLECVKVLGEPLIRLREGNAMWRPHRFEIWAFMWPKLIWGFEGYSVSAKKRVIEREPWRNPKWVFFYRAMGSYSLEEFKKFLANRELGIMYLLLAVVAIFPGRLANVIGVLYLVLVGKGASAVCYELIISSRYSNALSRWLASPWLGKIAMR
jgi:abequosyltransferase